MHQLYADTEVGPEKRRCRHKALSVHAGIGEWIGGRRRGSKLFGLGRFVGEARGYGLPEAGGAGSSGSGVGGRDGVTGGYSCGAEQVAEKAWFLGGMGFRACLGG